MVTEDRPLDGVSVLVTRPAGRAADITALIESHGGEVIGFPVIDIAPPADPGAVLNAVESLGKGDLAVFVSVNALEGVQREMSGAGKSFPEGVRVAAVGPTTAAACREAGIEVHHQPEDRVNSEGLLADLEGTEVRGRRAVIFRGQAGREVLRDALVARGAAVTQVECYRREVTEAPVEPLIERWNERHIDVVLLSSAAMVDALCSLLGDEHIDLLEASTILTYSRRVAGHCRDTGLLAEILVARKPSDAATLDALLEWAGD